MEAVACSELRSELWSHSAPARGAPAVNARCATRGIREIAVDALLLLGLRVS